MSELAGFIRDVGFPVFVAVYLLLRLDKMLRQVLDCLRDIRQGLNGLAGRGPSGGAD